MKKLLKEQYFWYAAVASIAAVLFAYVPQITAAWPLPFHTDPRTAYYMAGYRLLIPLAVVFAAWRFGVKVGLSLCLALTLVILASIIINSGFPYMIIDFSDIAIAAMLSWMVGRQGELKQRLEDTAIELEENYLDLVQEIAERKKVEEQYLLIAGHTADIIYKMTIGDWEFNYVSPSVERSLGYTPDEALSLDLGDVLTQESFQKQNVEFITAMQRGIESATLQLDLKHKDGRIISFEVHASLVRDKEGNPAEIVGVARDITDRKKIETRLAMQDRLASIGELTSGMAHEINNPLTSIINFSSLLLKKDVDEESRQDLNTIHQEAQRIAGIVKNLVSFSRTRPQEKRPSNINDAIQRILDMRAYEQGVNNIKVYTHLDLMLPQVMADSAQLEQVFFNIIINAEYFMRETNKGGILDIMTKREGGNIVAIFTDNGPGIAEENIKSIFSPFFTTKQAGRGTGLSLSICQGIINEHGGRIYAQNHESGGATFVVELPVLEK